MHFDIFPLLKIFRIIANSCLEISAKSVLEYLVA